MERFTDYLTGIFPNAGDTIISVVGALLTLIVGLFVAGFLRRLTKRIVKGTGLDSKLAKDGKSSVNVANMVSKLIYYLVVLFVLMLVLDMLGAGNALEPLKNMWGKFAEYLPNVIGAGIIGYAAYMLAQIASEAVAFLADKLDDVSHKAGLTDTFRLSKIAKQLAFIFVFVPLLIVALDTLGMKVITDPAKDMLNTMLGAIPNIIVAALIILVFYIFGRFVLGTVTELMKNLGVDDMPARMGISNLMGEGRSLSKMVGNIGFFFLMFFGVITAVEKLGFANLSTVLNDLLSMTGHIFFGLIVLVIGNHISKLVSEYVAGTDAKGLSTVVRYATLGLFLAIGLRMMGIADDIVNLAFGLTLGAVAVAFALSFGLGGREAAGKEMERFFNRFRKGE
ncbi:MAG: mechanosensitive ion channel [Bacteroidota bacterium]